MFYFVNMFYNAFFFGGGVYLIQVVSLVISIPASFTLLCASHDLELEWHTLKCKAVDFRRNKRPYSSLCNCTALFPIYLPWVF